MPGLTFSNERSHATRVRIRLCCSPTQQTPVNKVPPQRIREIILDALSIEREFITESLPEFDRYVQP